MKADGWTGERMGLSTEHGIHHLFVRDTGPRSGAATLFLHGFPTSSLDWRKVAPAFTDRRAVFVDLLGFGASDKPRLRYSYPLHADLVTALLERLAVHEVSIVAHDYAVTLAQELLRRGALPIRRLVLLNGGVYGRLHRQQAVHRILRTPVLGAIFARLFSARALARSLNRIAGAHTAWTAEDAEQHWRAITARGGVARIPALVHYIADRQTSGAAWEASMEAAAERIGFVWGLADPVSGAHVLDEVRVRMPAARVVALPDVGHYPHWEAPERTAAAIGAMLTP